MHLCQCQLEQPPPYFGSSGPMHEERVDAQMKPQSMRALLRSRWRWIPGVLAEARSDVFDCIERLHNPPDATQNRGSEPGLHGLDSTVRENGAEPPAVPAPETAIDRKKPPKAPSSASYNEWV
jgi:hypothetical protein